mmetsp:Transcript_5539/g.14157  ORF Transcript_5539/g.14157 Transcript_5539/m.14157 type:complete len:196 (-) Transcript_5539:170-757(-)
MEAALRETSQPVMQMVEDDDGGAVEVAAGETSMARVPSAPAPRIGADRRRIIYPLYLDRSKSVQQGRKVSMAVAVEEPTAQEIHEVCAELNIKSEVEQMKQHTRDWGVFGRVRVEILDDDGKPVVPGIATRRQLMTEICRRIPQLKHRVDPPKEKRVTIQHQLGIVPWVGPLPAAVQAAIAPPQPQKAGKKGKKK